MECKCCHGTGQVPLEDPKRDELVLKFFRELKSFDMSHRSNPLLECAKCGERYVGQDGTDYSAGVFCPECKRRGFILVGVCHVIGRTSEPFQVEDKNGSKEG